jgi:recombinational DNA repair protein RecT
LKTGDTLFKYITIDEVKDHRKQWQKTTDSKMSDSDYGEKTVMRKLINRSEISKDNRYSKMINADDDDFIEMRSGADDTYEKLKSE